MAEEKSKGYRAAPGLRWYTHEPPRASKAVSQPAAGDPIDLSRVRSALARHRAALLSDSNGERRAAVAAVLRDRGDGTEVLLIRRASREGDPWSGHMALPGGRQQGEDRDLLHTAIRETEEEVGLDLGSGAELVGRLDDLPAMARGRPAGLIIASFVFELFGAPALTTNAEVDEALWTPLAPLAGGALDSTLPYELDGRKFTLPAWDVEGRIVWGLTHRILSTLFEVVRAPASTARS
jgi:8-oxo-dGTP pyrophosphatase MutT (NUDIX family)